MSDEKQLIIHFNNGTKMEVSFHTQMSTVPTSWNCAPSVA